ncbi:MAG: hypothetical protein WC560_07550 [Syntrophales bacterium]
MTYGRGFGRGFGFRGNSPPWPYIGLGRGGLPRCWAYLSYPPYEGTQYSEAYPSGTEYSYPAGFRAPGISPSGPAMPPDQELDFLKGQSERLRQQLEQIDARVEKLRSMQSNNPDK